MPAAAIAATPREALTSAIFASAPKADVLRQLDAAKANAEGVLKSDPDAREAKLVRAMAGAYRAKLTKSRSGAIEAKAQFDALVKADPRDPDAVAAVGGWHIDVVSGVGSFLAKTMVGADKNTGLAALDRAVTLGGNRALYPALNALLRLQLSPGDPRAVSLAEAAQRGAAPTTLDRQLQRGAASALAAVKRGDGKAAQRIAIEALPLGRVGG